MIALGTRPAAGDHWFQRWLNGEADHVQQYTAVRNDPIDAYSSWLAANPALPFLPSLERTIRREAGRALRSPEKLAAFRALRLNLGTADTVGNPLLEPETWARCEADELPERAGPYCLGADLGDGAAMSALAAYWPGSGRLEALAAFPAIPGLRERGLHDAVGSLYSDLHRSGGLILTPGRAVSVPALLGRALAPSGGCSGGPIPG